MAQVQVHLHGQYPATMLAQPSPGMPYGRRRPENTKDTPRGVAIHGITVGIGSTQYRKTIVQYQTATCAGG